MVTTTTTTITTIPASNNAAASSLTYLSPQVEELKKKVEKFVEEEVIPAEKEYVEHMKMITDKHGVDARFSIDAIPPCLKRLQQRAKELQLWNMFIPPRLLNDVPSKEASHLKPKLPLSYREYGIICEILGKSVELAPQACNCSAPDTGNMEVLLEFGTPQQKRDYLLPLLNGNIRSTFLMTEPNVASSDPTNLETKLMKKIVKKPGGGEIVEYVLSGRKWWSTGAMDPRCRVALVVAKMDYSHPSCSAHNNNTENSNNKHGAHTIVIVPLPHPNIKMIRPLTVFGYDDAPFGHAEVLLENVKLTTQNLILGEGSGFQISQARLGPGRIHHCMRSIGMAQRCYELMLSRVFERQTFGKYLVEHDTIQEQISNCISNITCARLLTLDCASQMDMIGPKLARQSIACIKVMVPQLSLKVIDTCLQIFGGGGFSEDYVIAKYFAALRTLRVADGPDAVHKRTIARIELKKAYKQKRQQEKEESSNSIRSRL